MGHQIAEAILENGKITYSDKKLPEGVVKVHIIYDVAEQLLHQEATSIVKETSGLYKGIDSLAESQKLRGEWDRYAGN